VIGTADGLPRFERWATRMRGYIPAPQDARAHLMAWPGFEAAFSCEWPAQPLARLAVDHRELMDAMHLADRHEAVYRAVELFLKPILAYVRREEVRPTLWFVVVPEEVYRLGRPNSVVPRTLRQPSTLRSGDRVAWRSVKTGQGLLFADDVEWARLRRFANDFHNQLKARLLRERISVQLVRETTLAPEDFAWPDGKPKRKVQDEATRAWNLGVATLFKGEGKPWSLAAARPGVCYVGLVFRRVPEGPETHACCGAQMFLESGDGTVFRGAMGPWRSVDRKCPTSAPLRQTGVVEKRRISGSS
jgi:hypothetical protein